MTKERKGLRKDLGLPKITIWDHLFFRTINVKSEIKHLTYKLKKKLGLKYWSGDTLKSEYYNEFAKYVLNNKF